MTSSSSNLVPHTGGPASPPARSPSLDSRADTRIREALAGAGDSGVSPSSTVERRHVTSGFRTWGPSKPDVASGSAVRDRSEDGVTCGARSSVRDGRRVAFTDWSEEPDDAQADVFDSKRGVYVVSDQAMYVNSRQRRTSDGSSCDERKSLSVERTKPASHRLRRTSGYGSIDRSSYEKLDGDVCDYAGVSSGIQSIGLPATCTDAVCSVGYPTSSVFTEYTDVDSAATQLTDRNKFVTVRRRPDQWFDSDLMGFDSDVEQASTTPVRGRLLSRGNVYDAHHVKGPVSSDVTVKSVVVKPERGQYTCRPSQFDAVYTRNSMLESERHSAKVNKEMIFSDSDDEPLVKVKSQQVNRKIDDNVSHSIPSIRRSDKPKRNRLSKESHCLDNDDVHASDGCRDCSVDRIRYTDSRRLTDGRRESPSGDRVGSKGNRAHDGHRHSSHKRDGSSSDDDHSHRSRRDNSKSRKSRRHRRNTRSSSASDSNSDSSKDYRRRRQRLKPPKFDGSGSFETFYATFVNCSDYNRWKKRDQLAHLKSCLTGEAGKVLWDSSPEATDTLAKLVDLLRNRYGGSRQADKYRMELRLRRRASGESLSNLYRDVRRLMALAHPDLPQKHRETIACDYYIDSLNDADFALKVRERNPSSLDEALRISLQLEAWGKDTARIKSTDDKCASTRQAR